MTWQSVVLYALAILVIICAYGLGYFKAKLKDSMIFLEIIDRLRAKLNTYTDNTYDEKANAFFQGAHWVLNTYKELDD